MSEIELTRDSMIEGDRWRTINQNRWLEVGNWVDDYMQGVFVNVVGSGGEYVYGTGITPDTARSMASALKYFADQADKYKEAES